MVVTDEVDRVCAGTLERIDRTIEYVDGELGRETDAEPARIHVVDTDELIERCDGVLSGCVRKDEVTIRWDRFEEVLAHEVVHERVGRTPARYGPALFTEGIACALGRTQQVPDEEQVPPSVDAVLLASASSKLAKLDGGYYHAGELTHWLIETHGMPAVLDFMTKLRPVESPNRIRKLYTAHFGTVIDDDLFTHDREDADLNREQLGCLGPELTRDPERPRFRLQADLNCDSTRVQNLWGFRDRVYVEWTISIDEDDAGFWAPVRFTGDERIPQATHIEIDACSRERWHRRRWTPERNEPVVLEPGLYRIHWMGPMDGDQALALDLAGPCDPAAPNCADEEVCMPPGVCWPRL